MSFVAPEIRFRY